MFEIFFISFPRGFIIPGIYLSFPGFTVTVTGFEGRGLYGQSVSQKFLDPGLACALQR